MPTSEAAVGADERLYVCLASGIASRKSVEEYGVEPGRSEPEMWRIAFTLEGFEYVSSTGFMRKIDACMALDAMQKEGIVDRKTLLAVPFKKRIKIMTEALQW